MAIKFFVTLLLISAMAVFAKPYQHGGHAHDGGGGKSHQSVHIVSHGGDEHGDQHGHGRDGHDDSAEYHFNYGVEDKQTGDIKGHSESRKGHKVSGHYELVDADGHKRTVHYMADKHKGFQATVHYEPTHHQVPQHSGHGHFHGGHAEFTASSANVGHGHDVGYGHGYGHGHGKSHTSSFSLKQEHATGGHGEHGGYGAHEAYNFGHGIH